ncbi:MAG: hypothetical protein FWD99_07035 [Oscillospiraceae bacterium]|nr:hypothetical protein [Oscillospiraceae bacterium]
MTNKPEHMTQLLGDALVSKNHPRIIFRGKLDSLQAQVVLIQCQLQAVGEQEALIADLQDILTYLREIMRCEVLDTSLTTAQIIGLTYKELREQSHNPQKFFNVEQMALPDYTQGKTSALLNSLRTAVRETEAAAVSAFESKDGVSRPDLIRALNRLSGAVHILMCRVLAEQ